jgi:hypothetical protein
MDDELRDQWMAVLAELSRLGADTVLRMINDARHAVVRPETATAVGTAHNPTVHQLAAVPIDLVAEMTAELTVVHGSATGEFGFQGSARGVGRLPDHVRRDLWLGALLVVIVCYAWVAVRELPPPQALLALLPVAIQILWDLGYK